MCIESADIRRNTSDVRTHFVLCTWKDIIIHWTTIQMFSSICQIETLSRRLFLLNTKLATFGAMIVFKFCLFSKFKLMNTIKTQIDDLNIIFYKLFKKKRNWHWTFSTIESSVILCKDYVGRFSAQDVIATDSRRDDIQESSTIKKVCSHQKFKCVFWWNWKFWDFERWIWVSRFVGEIRTNAR